MFFFGQFTPDMLPWQPCITKKLFFSCPHTNGPTLAVLSGSFLFSKLADFSLLQTNLRYLYGFL